VRLFKRIICDALFATKVQRKLSNIACLAAGGSSSDRKRTRPTRAFSATPHDGQRRCRTLAEDPGRTEPRAAYPRAAAQTRVVSLAGIRLQSWESVRAFKGIICHDISEFESYMPSHAVWSLWAMSALRNYAQQRRQRMPARCTHWAAKKAPRDSGAQGRRKRPGREVPIDEQLLTPSSPLRCDGDHKMWALATTRPLARLTLRLISGGAVRRHLPSRLVRLSGIGCRDEPDAVLGASSRTRRTLSGPCRSVAVKRMKGVADASDLRPAEGMPGRGHGPNPSRWPDGTNV
jgi:hypothetical protein